MKSEGPTPQGFPQCATTTTKLLAYQKWVLQVHDEDIAFSHNVLDFVPLDDCLLLQHLDGVAHARLLVPAKVDL